MMQSVVRGWGEKGLAIKGAVHQGLEGCEQESGGADACSQPSAMKAELPSKGAALAVVQCVVRPI